MIVLNHGHLDMRCDHPGCTTGMISNTAGDARFLTHAVCYIRGLGLGLGWSYLPSAGPSIEPFRDYCPDHPPEIP